MRLTRVEIEGYRSIANKVDFHIDQMVTVLLGANDHGKTNILNALQHLNEDQPFDEETDLNWDRAGAPEKFPCIVFHFDLEPPEREEILNLGNADLAEEEAAAPAPARQAVKAAPAPAPEPAELDDEAPEHEPPPVRQLALHEIPKSIRIERRGLTGSLHYIAYDISSTVMEEFAKDAVPRVELIRPQEKVPDAVAVADLDKESHEFMRGIFYYAGLSLEGLASLFTQTDETMMRLKQASVKLNATLKADWTQGKDLGYELGHDSKTGQILLRIQDPAVTTRLVRASHRSSGFTHFFALKTVLYARQQDHPANSYIFLFDEPGIYLHPSGQYDLLQVIGAIAKHNQVIYSTHSLFMINKTFPVRHRLIVKTEKGTKVDEKPFVGRWGPAIEELGFSLAGTILFAQHVLLAEGDADPMLIHFLFQKLMEWGKANVDLNAFSVISTGNSKNTDALIRILKEGASAPQLLVLVDGDKGGAERLKKIQPLLDGHKVKGARLEDGLTTEDYLPGAGDSYVSAAARYVGRVAELLGSGPTPEQVATKFREAVAADGFTGDTPTTGIADWVLKKGKQFGKLKTPPSKIGIAREYIEALGSATFSGPQLQRAVHLLNLVKKELGLPELREPEAKVTTD